MEDVNALTRRVASANNNFGFGVDKKAARHEAGSKKRCGADGGRRNTTSSDEECNNHNTDGTEDKHDRSGTPLY